MTYLTPVAPNRFLPRLFAVLATVARSVSKTTVKTAESGFDSYFDAPRPQDVMTRLHIRAHYGG